MFLLFVLVLRLLAGKPTTIMLNSRSAYIITEKEVQYVTPDFFDQEVLPDATWYLVDCRDDLQSVPGCIMDSATLCRGFILQAASQRSDNLAWLTKTDLGIPPRLYMSVWTLKELICACVSFSDSFSVHINITDHVV